MITTVFKRSFVLFLLCAASAFAQNVRVDNIAFTTAGLNAAFIANAVITVCGPAGSGLPCTPKVSGLCLNASDVTCNQPNPTTSDAFGNYGFWIQPGTYVISVTKAGVNGFSTTLTLPCAAASCTIPGSLSVSGTATFTNTTTGIQSCIINGTFYISSLSCWAGSDWGAQAITAVNAMPTTGGQLVTTPGNYSFSTPFLIGGAGNAAAKDFSLFCPTGPSQGQTANRATLTFTGTNNTAIGLTALAFQMDGCNFITANTGNVALKLNKVNQTHIRNNLFDGFFTSIRVTGDGASGFSVGTWVENNRVNTIQCSTGASGISLDHVTDAFINYNEVYNVIDCATNIPLIIDRGATGIWLTGGTWEQGLHAAVVQSTNLGGAYAQLPSALFVNSTAFDLSTGGDALLFDSSLGTTNIQFFCTLCWEKGAGLNSAGTVVTAGAIGVNIQGGSNINFWGGTMSRNASWGYKNNSTGTNFSVVATLASSNNQGNTANVGGAQIGASPANWRILDSRLGNTTEEGGGHSAFGIDASLASAGSGYFCNNDLRGNNSARTNMPGGLGTLTVDVPECFQANGAAPSMAIHGSMAFVEDSNALTGATQSDLCQADATLHQLKCSYNNNSNGVTTAFPLPQTGNTSGTHSDSGFYQTAQAAGCTTAASIGGTCATPTTITWPTPFADTNYKVTGCQGVGAITNFPIMGAVTITNASSITVQTMALTAAAASFTTISCEAVHN